MTLETILNVYPIGIQIDILIDYMYQVMTKVGKVLPETKL